MSFSDVQLAHLTLRVEEPGGVDREKGYSTGGNRSAVSPWKKATAQGEKDGIKQGAELREERDIK